MTLGPSELTPKRIEVHEDEVGVVHYEYFVTVADEDGLHHVEGRRTEVYGRAGDAWRLISMSGGSRPV